MTRRFPHLSLIVVLVIAATRATTAEVVLTEGTNLSLDVANDGRIVIDLLGGLWVVPAGGGNASPIGAGLLPASKPRFSPDGEQLVYQARGLERSEIWLQNLATGAATILSGTQASDWGPVWHPDGERVTFTSGADHRGLDLWEIDVPTGLRWRLTRTAGDEMDPAWSDNGRDLVYVHAIEQKWSLVLRRHGEPDQLLLTSDAQISSPAWRPDGSLISFLHHRPDGIAIDIVILSEPVLHRTLITGEDFFVSPVAWLDPQHMFYAAGGAIRQRPFDSWTSTALPFKATIAGNHIGNGNGSGLSRELPDIGKPESELIVRAARLFDGIDGRYKINQDIVIKDGRITAVETQRERPGKIVVDLGDLAVLPGFVDAYAKLPGAVDEFLGPLLLSFGLTTLVAEHDDAERLNALWSGKEMPGPRILAARSIDRAAEGTPPWLITISGDISSGARNRDEVRLWRSQGVPVLAENWQVGLGSGASLLLGAESLPSSPLGRRYEDLEQANGSGALTLVSGLADASTPGLAELLDTRQAREFVTIPSPERRFDRLPELGPAAATLLLGSKPANLPPGLALHAEFRALKAAGLSGEQALKAAGVNVSAALGLGLRVGRIAVGAEADLVFVDGDPLAEIEDAVKIVAVVRNGRFFSTAGLIDRVQMQKNVE